MHSDPIIAASPSAQGAPCPLHPGASSIATCERCGTFMCATCVGPEGATTCPTCSDQVWTFPVARRDWSVSGLFSFAWEAFKPAWLMLSVAMIIFVIAYYAVALVAGLVIGMVGGMVTAAIGENVVTGGLVGLLVAGAIMVTASVLAMGLNRICLDVYQGRPVLIGALFSQMGQLHLVAKMGAALVPAYGIVFGLSAGVTAVSEMAGFITTLLVVVPFAMAMGIAMMLLMVGFVVHPELGFVQHLKRVGAMMRGQIFGTIGLMFMGGLALMAGALLCGIGMIPAYGLYMMLMVGLYLTLENDPAFELSRTRNNLGLDTIR